VAININPNAFSPSATGTRPAERAAATSDARAAASTSSGTIVQDGVSLSTTSRQLAQSAIQAEQRDASLTRSQLADEASRLRDQFSGNTYNEAAAVREVPDTDDPALLERAKQATDFTQSHGQRGTNPFANLSDDQLTLVMYDDSGSYTTNERRAAYLEQTDRRQDWKKSVVAAGMAEYKATGQNDKFFQNCIDYYEGLPPIEQAQYPVDYVERRQHWIENNKPYSGAPTINAIDR
jgi:hypothetical protein